MRRDSNALPCRRPDAVVAGWLPLLTNRSMSFADTNQTSDACSVADGSTLGELKGREVQKKARVRPAGPGA